MTIYAGCARFQVPVATELSAARFEILLRDASLQIQAPKPSLPPSPLNPPTAIILHRPTTSFSPPVTWVALASASRTTSPWQGPALPLRMPILSLPLLETSQIHVRPHLRSCTLRLSIIRNSLRPALMERRLPAALGRRAPGGPNRRPCRPCANVQDILGDMRKCG